MKAEMLNLLGFNPGRAPRPRMMDQSPRHTLCAPSTQLSSCRWVGWVGWVGGRVGGWVWEGGWRGKRGCMCTGAFSFVFQHMHANTKQTGTFFSSDARTLARTSAADRRSRLQYLMQDADAQCSGLQIRPSGSYSASFASREREANSPRDHWSCKQGSARGFWFRVA